MGRRHTKAWLLSALVCVTLQPSHGVTSPCSACRSITVCPAWWLSVLTVRCVTMSQELDARFDHTQAELADRIGQLDSRKHNPLDLRNR